MEEVRQLISSRQVRILKSMGESSAEKQILDDEERASEQRSKAQEADREREEKRLRQAERQAQRALDQVKHGKNGEKPRPVEDLTTDELLLEYDRWDHLQDKLQRSTEAEIANQVKGHAEQIRQELLLRGVNVDLPQRELAALSHMPATYSAEFLNNLTEATLGVKIQEDDRIPTITVSEDGKTITVPRGPLTIEDTLRIAQEISKANPELLASRLKEIEALGINMRDFASYLSLQTKVIGGRTVSIFDTEAQKQAIVQLYNAGVQLAKLGKAQQDPEHGKITSWRDLQREGEKFQKEMEKLSPEKQAARKAAMLEFVLGKGLGEGRISTSYQRLLRHFQTDGKPREKAEEELRQWLLAKVPWLLRHLAPHIAESFVTGEAARNIARGVAKGQAEVPNVIFEQARVATDIVGLPQQVKDVLSQRFGVSFDENTRHLLTAARQLAAMESFQRKPLEDQLAILTDMVRPFQAPNEFRGEKIRGYDLANVFANEDAAIGCAVRAYLLTRVMQAVYPEGQRPSVVADTMLFPNANGAVGHTRLMISGSSGAKVFIVDPSIQTTGTGVKLIEDGTLAGQVREVAATGKSLPIFVTQEELPQGEREELRKRQIIGDAITSQESNIIANIAAARPQERRQMLQLALQRDPNNQMALLHLAALSGDNKQEQNLYLGRLKQINPELSEGRIQAMLQANASEFQVAVSLTAFTEQNINDIVTKFYTDYNAHNPGNPLNPGDALYTVQTNQQGQAIGTTLNIPITAVNLKLLRQLQLDLTTAVNDLQANKPAAFPQNLKILNDLIDPGDPRRGKGPGEVAAAIAEITEIRSATPEGFWQDFQETMSLLEKSRLSTGLGTLEGNYTISNQLQQQLEAERAKGRFDRIFLDRLQSELQVRSAAHDVVVIATREGRDGAQRMGQVMNRISPEDLLRADALPGVQQVRRMVEQEMNFLLASQGGITPTDFERIQDRVRRRFDSDIAAGLVDFQYSQATNPENYALEKERAITLGINFLTLETREQHFIALGDPALMGGIGIGNTRLDFIVQIYSPGYWNMFRFGTASPHVKPIIEYLGHDEIDRMLYLQDFRSSAWRVPTYLQQFERVLGADHKQALFMRLYFLGETFASPDTHDPMSMDLGKDTPGQDKFLIEQMRRGLTHEQAEVALEHERLRLVDDIIKYVPEELASIFHDHPDMHALTNRPEYRDFLNQITLIRERCIKDGDFTYAHFDEYLQGARELIPAAAPNPLAIPPTPGHPALFFSDTSREIYSQLTGFLTNYRHELADPDAVFNFKDTGKARKHRHDKKPAWRSHDRINPLFRKRVYSLADAPFERIDMIDNGSGQKVVNDEFAKALGGQPLGRELGSIGGAYGAMEVIYNKYFHHPSIEVIKEAVGKILAYKGNAQDVIVRDLMYQGLIFYIQEFPALRALMPGLDDMIGKLIKGGSIMQREMGPYAPSFKTADLVQLTKTAIEDGLISHHKAEEAIAMARKTEELLGLLAWSPQLQLIVFLIFTAFIKTALNPKELLSAA